MSDPTEDFRREAVSKINSDVETNDADTERARLEKEYGEVWDTKELSENFEVVGFLAPYCVVRRKSDGKKGTIMFQHLPRLYFKFQED